MSTTSTNLSLVKATGSEVVSIVQLDANWDLVDAVFGSTAVGAAGAAAAMLRDVGITTSYTGSTAKNTLDVEPVWNTSGTMRGLYIAVTHTAAGGSSRAIEVRRGANTIFDVDITTATAVNGVGVLGSAAGTGATLQTIGADTNIDLLLVAKGSGVVKADGIEVVTLTASQTLTTKSLTSPTLTGTVAGTPTWASSQAITLSTAAQPNITSLGSLAGLTLASGQLLLPVGSAASPSLYFDSGNGIYSQGTDRLGFATAGVVRAEIDAAGNMGVGVTPSAWHASMVALQQGQIGALWANATAGSMRLSANTFYDGANKALITAAASIIELGSGALIAYTAPSANAGTPQVMTERMRIDLAGNVGIGVTPSAWNTGRVALQVGAAASLLGHPSAEFLELVNNSYIDAGAAQRALVTAAASRVIMSAGTVAISTAPSTSATFTQTFTDRFVIDVNGNIFTSGRNLAVGATNGFFNIPIIAGTPTGTPTQVSGQTPIVFDVPANKLWVWNPNAVAWKSVTLA